MWLRADTPLPLLQQSPVEIESSMMLECVLRAAISDLYSMQFALNCICRLSASRARCNQMCSCLIELKDDNAAVDWCGQRNQKAVCKQKSNTQPTAEERC